MTQTDTDQAGSSLNRELTLSRIFSPTDVWVLIKTSCSALRQSCSLSHFPSPFLVAQFCGFSCLGVSHLQFIWPNWKIGPLSAQEETLFQPEKPLYVPWPQSCLFTTSSTHQCMRQRAPARNAKEDGSRREQFRSFIGQSSVPASSFFSSFFLRSENRWFGHQNLLYFSRRKFDFFSLERRVDYHLGGQRRERENNDRFFAFNYPENIGHAPWVLCYQ